MEMIAEEGPFSNVINLTEGEVIVVQKEWSGDGHQLCRICANTADYLIPIYEGQGLEHKIEEKIGQHLPIKVIDGFFVPRKKNKLAILIHRWNKSINSCSLFFLGLSNGHFTTCSLLSMCLNNYCIRYIAR